jgi:hypothetical protein
VIFDPEHYTGALCVLFVAALLALLGSIAEWRELQLRDWQQVERDEENEEPRSRR